MSLEAAGFYLFFLLPLLLFSLILVLPPAFTPFLHPLFLSLAYSFSFEREGKTMGVNKGLYGGGMMPKGGINIILCSYSRHLRFISQALKRSSLYARERALGNDKEDGGEEHIILYSPRASFLIASNHFLSLPFPLPTPFHSRSISSMEKN